ncbi:type II toxin-antitoxin system HicB family antitoxin [Flammeovirga sp. MY04]|uniref:type II toxin-antitoxin system HicB family antitoxin n=1 Tax=Flammeovirga sp. MY04 TaxID=1191459 RepID=UPI0008257004|nr:type II toxin-antitoxin system HicB family antitoxin [Flammeovirga sp. MY04]ANQ51990.2 type II toxin-antitoxin system HicB family antitoxin [Flammeovirga sp. MY04]
MKNLMEYKGYFTKPEFDAEDMIIHGKILFISDAYIFHGESLSEYEKMFQESVEMYLEDCKELGKTPQKTFKGSLNVRLTPENHRLLALKAAEQGISINKLIDKTLTEFVHSA